MSVPTLTDWAQLLPDRHVTVDRTGPGLTVLIDGLSQSPPHAVEVVLEELTGDLTDAQLPEAVVAIDGDDTAGVPVWRAAAGSAVARGAVGTPIAVPLSPPAAHPQRLRIREIEQYGSSEGAAPEGTVPASAAELTQRSTFIDTVNLPESWTSSSP